MIDKIFDMLIKEALSRPGQDLSHKLFTVVGELDAKLMAKFEELCPDFNEWLPDDQEELGKANFKPLAQEAKKKYDRGNL